MTYFQKHMLHIEAMKPQADANLAVLKEVISLNKMTKEQKAALTPIELIEARRLAQQEFFAARKAGKLNYKGFGK